MRSHQPALILRLFTYLGDLGRFRPYQLASLILLMLLRSLSEGITLLLLLPLLAAIGIAPSDGGTFLTNILQPLLPVGLPARDNVTLVLAIFLLAMLLRSAIGLATALAVARYLATFSDHLRRRVYDALCAANWPYLTRNEQARSTHALTMQIEAVASTTAMALALLASILTLLTVTTVIVLISPWPALTIATIAALTGLSLLSGIARAYQQGNDAVKAGQQLFSMLTSRMSGLKLGKAFSIERQLQVDFAASSGALRDAVLRVRRNAALNVLLQEVGGAVILVVFVWVGITLYGLPGADLVAPIIIFSRLLPIVVGLQNGLRLIVAGLPDYDSLRNLERGARQASDTLPDRSSRLSLGREIAIENVGHKYDGAENWALRNVSLDLPAHSVISVVGLSGSGKSTFADILAGLVVPAEGRLVVDGEPIDERLRPSWRAAVSYVPQDAPLFNATIRANLLLGARDAHENDIWRCLRLSGAEHIVRRQADGLETVIGDQGLRLSGGERQRIRLASALLQRPHLLILDEATSALSSSDEAPILEGISRNKENMTVVIISHSASAIAYSDVVIRIADGTACVQKARHSHSAHSIA